MPNLPYVTANGISLHFKLQGEGGRSIVLLHEIGGSLHSWDGVAPGLAERFCVLRFDQRGFGLSEKVRKPYAIETLVDDLEALIAATSLPPPYHVVSLAASSMQAIVFHERHRARIASLVFLNPAPGVNPSRAEALNAIAAKAESEGIRAVLPVMLDKSYPPGLSDSETYEAYRGRYLANDPIGFALAFRMMARTDLVDRLSAISCPSLVVAGRQDFVRAVSVTEGLAKRIAGARFEVIDAGHFMPTTSPKALLDLLLDFWKGIQA